MIASLAAEDLAHFQRKLTERQRQLRHEVEDTGRRAERERFTDVASEAPDREDAALADLISDVNHAEVERDVDELGAIEEALGRISAGSYGLCRRCGEPIERARLEAYPTAKYDLRCQEIVEQRTGQPRTPTL
jgi:RNA polymerase-binding transcription factor